MSNTTTGDILATPVTRLMAKLGGEPQTVPGPADLATTLPGWLQNGRYLVRREIACGGMGRVYLVYDHELEREVALKVMLQPSEVDHDFTAVFVEEARAVGQLEHPGIMPVYDIGLAPDQTLYFTMKYVEGQTMAALIQRLADGNAEAHAAYPFPTRVRIIVELAEALAYAHAQGILHRDIKPSNIMIGPFGEVTLMDWGLALRTRRRSEGQPVASTAIAQMAAEGMVSQGLSVGTPGYMPPEALTDPDLYNERSDIYSLGVVMYEFFTLHNAYPGRSGVDVIMAAMHEDPVQADMVEAKVQGRVPKEIALVVRKAMVREPESRYGGAQALIYAIQQYEKGEAPVVCVHTGLKRAVYGFAHLVDQHGHLVIIILAILLATPFLLALMWFIVHHF